MDYQHEIDKVKVWVGLSLKGGNYDGAQNVGVIKYESGTRLYVFSDLEEKGSSVQIQPAPGGSPLVLAEVEVYAKLGSE